MTKYGKGNSCTIKRIIKKFKEGEKIPENAVYLNSLLEHHFSTDTEVVYHYYEVHTKLR